MREVFLGTVYGCAVGCAAVVLLAHYAGVSWGASFELFPVVLVYCAVVLCLAWLCGRAGGG